MKKIICLFMLLLMVLPVISCTESKSDDELVREAVHLKMITAHYG